MQKPPQMLAMSPGHFFFDRFSPRLSERRFADLSGLAWASTEGRLSASATAAPPARTHDSPLAPHCIEPFQYAGGSVLGKPFATHPMKPTAAIKTVPEDFVVDEIPAYSPGGEGL